MNRWGASCIAAAAVVALPAAIYAGRAVWNTPLPTEPLVQRTASIDSARNQFISQSMHDTSSLYHAHDSLYRLSR
jgi:hypothetical protein